MNFFLWNLLGRILELLKQAEGRLPDGEALDAVREAARAVRRAEKIVGEEP